MKFKELVFVLISAIIIAYASVHTIKTTPTLEIQIINLDSITKIIDITDSLVAPVLYDSLLIEEFAPVDIRKKQFINQVLPAILIVRYQMEQKADRVEKIVRDIENKIPVSCADSLFVDSLMACYRANSYDNLQLRLKAHPNSVVLAQAAVESGWGLSRFASEGKNLFGVWTVSTDKNIIKSLQNRGEVKVFVKRYETITESIEHYFLTLGRHKAYRKFRMKRSEQDDVFELIKALDRYSEQGEAYTLLLQKIIKWNNLEQYDHYIIDPAYFKQEKWLKVQWEKYFKKNGFKEKKESNCNSGS
ncbi:MAG: glucosaminidase domain-containing protein [Prolixibacteraceae bacterium]|nr:glucosaminidase domain-containing protein [Prolixibacteraceae bacterium]